MRALILGNLRNTLGSTSIAVDTGLPVMGHLIITELIGRPPSIVHPDIIEWNSWRSWNLWIVTVLRPHGSLWIKSR